MASSTGQSTKNMRIDPALDNAVKQLELSKRVRSKEKLPAEKQKNETRKKTPDENTDESADKKPATNVGVAYLLN